MDVQKRHRTGRRIALLIFVLIDAILKPKPKITGDKELHIRYRFLAMPMIFRQEESEALDEARDGREISCLIRLVLHSVIQEP